MICNNSQAWPLTEIGRESDENRIQRLSVVINLLGGPGLERCLEALLNQHPPGPMEIIVPVCPGLDNVEEVRQRFPEVRLVEVDGVPHAVSLSDPQMAHMVYCRRRAVGLAAAEGDIVALTEDQVVPDPGWCNAIRAAHAGPYGAVGGAVENAREEALHRALYIFDFVSFQIPFPAGDAILLTDQNVSYKRKAIEKVRQQWEHLYHETAVHESLRAAGERLWITPAAVVRFDRGHLTLSRQLRERYAWGVVFGGERAQRTRALRRVALLALAPLVPAYIVMTRLISALRKGSAPGPTLASLPALFVMSCAWALGEVAGSIAGRPFPITDGETAAG